MKNNTYISIFAIIVILAFVWQTNRVSEIEKTLNILDNNFDAVDQRTSDLEGQVEELGGF